MIEQQYYTRERRGLFNETIGYDTVAKSPQLKLEYIKEVLHPICRYDIPSELQARGEQDEWSYPPSMIVMPGPYGELIVGQAVYKTKDFTGLHPTFFMHNLILSENEKRRFVKEPEKLFGITGFKTSLSYSESRQLPTLAGIAYEDHNLYFFERERLFSKSGMSQELFRKMINAIFVAVQSNKKIFIVLDVDIEKLGVMAKSLLYHLYLALPWSITEKLGVCTYANKALANNNFHITFLDKNTSYDDVRLEQEMVFDFVNKKYLNIDEDIEGEFYLHAALDYTRNKMVWEKVNRWAEVLKTTFKKADECGISFYGKVIHLVEMSLYLKSGKSYNLSNPSLRKGLLKQILLYLRSDIADDIRKELLDIMEFCIRMIQVEIKRGKLISDEELKMILSFKLDYCTNREQEERCIELLLYLLTISSRNKDYNYVYNVLDLVHPYQKAYIHLFEALCMNDELKKNIVYYLIDGSFRGIKIFNNLTEQMAKFEEVEFALIKDQYYTQVVYEKFAICLKAIKDLVSFLDVLQNWVKDHHGEIYTNLLEEGEYYFLEHIQLKNIESERTLCDVKFSRSYPLENYGVIIGYQKLKTDLSSMSPNNICINKKVQELVKVYYKQKVRIEDFYMLVYAFIEMEEETYQLKLNMEKVLAYLKDIQMNIMLEFIIWAKDQVMYIDTNEFDSQVIHFFVQLKQDGHKINKELIAAKLGKEAKTELLSQKILNALKPNLIRWLFSRKIGVAIGVGVIVGGISGIGIYCCQRENTINFQDVVELIPDSAEDREEIKVRIETKPEALSEEQLGDMWQIRGEEKNSVEENRKK